MKPLKIDQQKSFKDLTTFHIGGKIKYYIEAANEKEVDEAVCFAKSGKLKIFIIGGGSDILVSDANFNGVAIKFVGNKITSKGAEVVAEAGATWDDLVDFAVKHNLAGIECMSGIPGTCGATPIQNIGAYGQELKDTFVSLKAYDIDKEKVIEFKKEDCGFSYRESIFKKPEYWQKFFIIEIKLKLSESGQPEVKYDSLKNYLLEKNIKNPTLEDVRNAVLAIRAGKFEDPKKIGNAGSFFKNPILTKEQVEEVTKKFPEIPARIQDDETYKCSAAWFIEKSGWKGKSYKNAGVSPMHALILINPEGKAKANELIELSDKIISDVKDKFGVRLEREVQIIEP